MHQLREYRPAYRLKPGFEGERHGRTSGAVYDVGDQELNWSARDAFVVPNRMWRRHRNRSRGERAILFSVNDIPILAPLVCTARSR